MPGEDRVVRMTRVKCDIKSLPPQCPEGWWTATIEAQKVGATKPEKGAYPMITLGFELEEPDNPDHESFKGTNLPTWLVFFPEGHKAERTGKRRIREVCNAAGIDFDVVPVDIGSAEDLDSFMELLNGAKVRVFVKHEKNHDSDDVDAVITFREPGKAAPTPINRVETPVKDVEELEEEEEEELDEVEEEEKQEEEPEEERVPVRRGRGRPKGSKNAPATATPPMAAEKSATVTNLPRAAAPTSHRAR